MVKYSTYREGNQVAYILSEIGLKYKGRSTKNIILQPIKMILWAYQNNVPAIKQGRSTLGPNIQIGLYISMVSFWANFMLVLAEEHRYVKVNSKSIT